VPVSYNNYKYKVTSRDFREGNISTETLIFYSWFVEVPGATAPHLKSGPVCRSLAVKTRRSKNRYSEGRRCCGEIYLSTYPHIYGSTALVDLGSFFSFLTYTQSVGFLGRGINPLQGPCLHRINATDTDA
jgi:hypothetical protein